MKAILAGIVAAVVIAIGAAFVLNTEVQETVQVAFTTTGARL